ncbi:MAG: S8 family serine peptidase [Rhodospirillaceae bacterium]|nr:S8 family serine peptidase [Rhodospirillaceae bacterium]
MVFTDLSNNRTRLFLIQLIISFLTVVQLTTDVQADDWSKIRTQSAIATAYNFAPLPNNAGQGITIAVLTTGIANSLQTKLRSRVRNENFVTTEPASDLHGFGSHSVSILAALAPKATIISLKVLFKNGQSNFTLVAKGIERAVTLDANIIVITLGARPTANYSRINKAVANAQKKGIIVLAGAGNSGKAQIAYPANVDGVIAVGSTDVHDIASSYSNYGSKIVYAPGKNIIAHWKDKLRPISGTTRSVTVAGAIYAVLWSQHPYATARQIADAVTRTARIISVKGARAKRIDGAAALKALQR